MNGCRRLAATACLVAGASVAHAQASPSTAGASADVVAGGRMGTENGALTLYTANAPSPSGLVWPGPQAQASQKRVPIGRIVGGGSGVYNRCKLAYTNWYQGQGVSLKTTATAWAGASTLTVASAAGVIPGDAVTGPHIPAGDTVTFVDTATSVWLGKPTTGPLSGAPVTIASHPASYGGNAGELTDTGGAISVAAGIRPRFGDTSAPPLVVAFDGKPSTTIAPGQTAWSDWVSFRAVPGQDIEVDTTVFWPSGAYVFGSHIGRTDLGENNASIATHSSILGTARDPTVQARPYWSAPVTGAPYGPVNMICSADAPADRQPGFVIIGDSIGLGADDSRTLIPSTGAYADLGDAAGYVGPWERAAEALHVGYANLSQSGKRLADFVTASQLVLSAMGGGPTHVVLALGVNDFGAGAASATTVEAEWIKAVTLLQKAGYKVIATTVGAETTTTDGGATTGGQTPLPGFGACEAAQTFNDWLRTTGAPTYTNGRLVDFANIVMSAPDSQVFRTDLGTFSDWYGRVTGLSWTTGSGGADGLYDIPVTGGGCTAPPALRVKIVAGAVSTAILTSAGIGCTTTPTVSTAAIPGLKGAAISLRVVPLHLGVHIHTGYDYTGAVFSNLGAGVTGATLMDANGAVARAIQPQLAAALAR